MRLGNINLFFVFFILGTQMIFCNHRNMTAIGEVTPYVSVTVKSTLCSHVKVGRNELPVIRNSPFTDNLVVEGNYINIEAVEESAGGYYTVWDNSSMWTLTSGPNTYPLGNTKLIHTKLIVLNQLSLLLLLSL